MHLHRVTPDPLENYSIGEKFIGTSSDDFRASKLQYLGEDVPREVVVTRFERFGGGAHRQSDFEVLSEWQDVERIIEKFCDVGHPQAIALQEAMKLATAAGELGWRPPHSN